SAHEGMQRIPHALRYSRWLGTYSVVQLIHSRHESLPEVDCGKVRPEISAGPERAGGTAGRGVGKVIVVDHGAYEARWFVREWVFLQKPKHIRRSFKEAHRQV